MGAEKPRPNLNDVARLAEVSPATVSRVLNQTAPVSAGVRERVLAAISDLGYQALHTSPTFALRVCENISQPSDPGRGTCVCVTLDVVYVGFCGSGGSWLGVTRPCDGGSCPRDTVPVA